MFKDVTKVKAGRSGWKNDHATYKLYVFKNSHWYVMSDWSYPSHSVAELAASRIADMQGWEFVETED